MTFSAIPALPPRMQVRAQEGTLVLVSDSPTCPQPPRGTGSAQVLRKCCPESPFPPSPMFTQFLPQSGGSSPNSTDLHGPWGGRSPAPPWEAPKWTPQAFPLCPVGRAWLSHTPQHDIGVPTTDGPSEMNPRTGGPTGPGQVLRLMGQPARSAPRDILLRAEPSLVLAVPRAPLQAHLSEARRLPLPNRLRMEREAGSLASRE